MLEVKNLLANAGDIRDTGLIPELGRSPGGGHGNPLQYSCLENPMDRGAWQATVEGVTKGSQEPSQQQSMGSQRIKHGRKRQHVCIQRQDRFTCVLR